MGVNDYFGLRQGNRPHETPIYGPGNLILKLIITDKYMFLQKKYLISGKTRKTRSISNLLF